MSIWGKVIGGVAGFALGGPLGALLGAAAGHAVDRIRGGGVIVGPQSMAARQAAFAVAVIVLSAKMAKADGQVTRDEIDAFKRMFRVPPGEMARVGKLFDQARQDTAGFEIYARQVGAMFRDHPAVLEELLNGLFHIARADGVLHPAELDYLQKVAAAFGLDQQTFERVRAGNVGPEDTDPYAVLGVERSMADDEIKAVYRKLIRENHPDALTAQGMPDEFVEQANEKMATINAAYDRIRKERGTT